MEKQIGRCGQRQAGGEDGSMPSSGRSALVTLERPCTYINIYMESEDYSPLHDAGVVKQVSLNPSYFHL